MPWNCELDPEHGDTKNMKPMALTHLGLLVVGGLWLTNGSAAAQQELFKLTASDGVVSDLYGTCVAVSGERAVIGAPFDWQVVPPSGSAYVVDVGTGQELLVLAASDGTDGDGFGSTVAISADRVLVGAPERGNSWGGTGRGSVYVFDTVSGLELFKLQGSTGSVGDSFGYSIAVDGERAVIGAPDFPDTFPSSSGLAYVYDVNTGVELFVLRAPAGTLQTLGTSVAIHGDRAIVAANGFLERSAYVFDVSTGQLLWSLTPPAIPGDFSWVEAVAIHGDFALIGNSQANGAGLQRGAVYAYDLTTGQLVRELRASDGADGDTFGFSLAIQGDRVLVGAPYDDESGTNSGSVYGFDLASGQQQFRLNASDGAADDRFGAIDGLALSGGRVIVGAAFHDDLGLDSGAAYLFSIPEIVGVPYCFGDGSGTACPCANVGPAGRGCINGSGSSGALGALARTSVVADDLRFAAGLPAGQSGLLFSGTLTSNGGAGEVFGDGLRCAGGMVRRLGTQSAGVLGSADFGPGLATLGGWLPGQTRHFQVWYRDPAGSCGSGFNTTNAVTVLFSL